MSQIILLITLVILIIICYLLHHTYHTYHTHNTHNTHVHIHKEEKEDKGGKEENNTPKIKILNLVLFSKDREYNQMYEITSVYYRKFSFVDTIYYLYDDRLLNEYSYDKSTNILRIRGKETYIPGILEKTIKAFKYAAKLPTEYDYYIRTNISTIVDFNRLARELILQSVDYGTGRTNYIPKGYRDEFGGIRDDRYHGTYYASGTCIIFSRELFMKMLNKIDKIDYLVIDDVAIGDFIKRYYPEYKLNGFDSLFFSTENVPVHQLSSVCKKNIFFRNRHANRKDDIIKMKQVVKLL